MGIHTKIAVLSANLGGFDKDTEHVPQSIKHTYMMFNYQNFPLRDRAMTPRLQAKIPKCFGWQMLPGHEYYMWLDGNITMSSPDTLKYFYDSCQDYDMVFLKHPKRNTVKWEARYLWRGLKDQSRYIVGRYVHELLDAQMAEINADKDFVDDLLVNGGMFMYRNTPEVRKVLKEWWYHISRYLIMDQCSLAYVLKKSGLKINVRPEVYDNCQYFKSTGHKYHAK